MPRFIIGARVRISSTDGSGFAGAHGIIDGLVANPRNITQLDCYMVLFSWGEKKTFWDAQLEAVADKRSRQNYEGAHVPKKSNSPG
jgi:hypothetical protein